jgi:23S rRNA pseudouridine1911/1915/1917 synthase
LYYCNVPEVNLQIKDFLTPQILAEEKDFLIAFKPPFMHSAPVRKSADETLLDWCFARYPETAGVPGRKAGEGGLLHRLDYETQGLVLLARSGPGLLALLALQKEGKIIKEYSAVAALAGEKPPGFPRAETAVPDTLNPNKAFRITSAFRPYGPGRKSVRPVPPENAPAKKNKTGKTYTTEILAMRRSAQSTAFLLGITNGFRHQIRCHLAWLGIPILNDSLYGGIRAGDGALALRAVSLSFIEPLTGKRVKYAIPEISH